MFPINYCAVSAAAVANFVIGFLFHGPIFGKTWMKLANVHPTGREKFTDMAPQLIKNFSVNLIFAYVLSVVYLFASTSFAMGGSGVLNGMMVAFWVWFGFVFTTTSIEVIWMGRPYKLWCFELCASLVSCLAMGVIIAVW